LFETIKLQIKVYNAKFNYSRSKPYEVHENDLKAYIVCEVEKAFENYSKK
jgi:hypothetical protein